MYRTDGRNENYDNASEVLIGAKKVIKRMLDNEDRAIIACKQMHDYRLQLYHFGTSTTQRAAQILSPGELDDVPLLPEFETPPVPKRQKKTVGARGRSKKHDISIADLETIEEDVDDETPEPSDNVVYLTSNDSTSKTSTPSEGFDHGGDEWERQEKLRMEFETMEQASDTSSYASTEGYYQGQGGYLAYRQYPDASYYTGGGAYAQSTESDSHSHDSHESYDSYQHTFKRSENPFLEEDPKDLLKKIPLWADLHKNDPSPSDTSFQPRKSQENPPFNIRRSRRRQGGYHRWQSWIGLLDQTQSTPIQVESGRRIRLIPWESGRSRIDQASDDVHGVPHHFSIIMYIKY
ncbi:hypothetical protein Taro_039431 [Colocasia esculenta]|uniref:Uncharacterized protein n=1 Tax=Colocasia esculenta TaxID=4460 RepID=A0A843W6E2_COLES|nr:hypothetical protein [Colocasia esculenta]